MKNLLVAASVAGLVAVWAWFEQRRLDRKNRRP